MASDAERRRIISLFLNTHGYVNDPLYTPRLQQLWNQQPPNWVNDFYTIIMSRPRRPRGAGRTPVFKGQRTKGLF